MITKNLAHIIEQQPASNISFDGVDFFDVQVNEIILKKILTFLKGKKKVKKSIEYGVIVHYISRAGYRLFQFGPDIQNDGDFELESKRICDTELYSKCGWFRHNERYYMIANSLADRNSLVQIHTQSRLDEIMKGD